MMRNERYFYGYYAYVHFLCGLKLDNHWQQQLIHSMTPFSLSCQLDVKGMNTVDQTAGLMVTHTTPLSTNMKRRDSVTKVHLLIVPTNHSLTITSDQCHQCGNINPNNTLAHQANMHPLPIIIQFQTTQTVHISIITVEHPLWKVNTASKYDNPSLCRVKDQTWQYWCSVLGDEINT